MKMPAHEVSFRGPVDEQAMAILRGAATAVAVWTLDPTSGVPVLCDADLTARLLLSTDRLGGGFPPGTTHASALRAACQGGQPQTVGVVLTELLGARTRLLVRSVPLGGDTVATVWMELPPEAGQGSELDALRQVAGVLGHDINNILQVAEGSLELALAGQDLEARLHAAHAALLRAREITDQLDAIAMRVPFAADLDLAALVRHLMPSVRQELPDNVVLAYALGEEGPWVHASSRALTQMVKNLVRNAVEALPGDTGEIVITVGLCSVDGPAPGYVGLPTAKGRYGYIEVRDNGEGIDPALHEKIFEPFYSTRGVGRGLGLCAAESVARAHGGALRLRSVVGEGTAIRILLPLLPVQVVGPSTTRGPSTDSEPISLAIDAFPSVVGRVLVVDDEEALRDLLVAALEPRGLEVVTADDGDTGLVAFRELVAAGALDCVILDLTMPRMGGVAALTEMRAIAPQIPVIVSSGYSSDEVAAQLGHLRPDALLRKPTPLAVLADEVRRVMSRARPHNG